MKRIVLVVLIALNGLCSIFAAPTKELRMPEQTVMPDGVAFPAAEEEQTGLVEAASASVVAENPVESKNQVVTNQPDRESAEAKSFAQDDEGWKWNGWKIAALVFLVLGIMGVVGVQLGWVMPSGNMGLVSSMPCVHLTMLLFLMSGLMFGFSYVPTVGKIFVYGVGGLFVLLCLMSLMGTSGTKKGDAEVTDAEKEIEEWIETRAYRIANIFSGIHDSMQQELAVLYCIYSSESKRDWQSIRRWVLSKIGWKYEDVLNYLKEALDDLSGDYHLSCMFGDEGEIYLRKYIGENVSNKSLIVRLLCRHFDFELFDGDSSAIKQIGAILEERCGDTVLTHKFADKLTSGGFESSRESHIDSAVRTPTLVWQSFLSLHKDEIGFPMSIACTPYGEFVKTYPQYCFISQEQHSVLHEIAILHPAVVIAPDGVATVTYCQRMNDVVREVEDGSIRCCKLRVVECQQATAKSEFSGARVILEIESREECSPSKLMLLDDKNDLGVKSVWVDNVLHWTYKINRYAFPFMRIVMWPLQVSVHLLRKIAFFKMIVEIALMVLWIVCMAPILILGSLRHALAVLTPLLLVIEFPIVQLGLIVAKLTEGDAVKAGRRVMFFGMWPYISEVRAFYCDGKVSAGSFKSALEGLLLDEPSVEVYLRERICGTTRHQHNKTSRSYGRRRCSWEVREVMFGEPTWRM